MPSSPPPASAGKLTTLDPKSPGSLATAADAVKLLNAGAYAQLGTSPFNLVQLVKITSQAGAGVHYHLTLKLADSTGTAVVVDVIMYITPYLIMGAPQEILTKVTVVSGGPHPSGAIVKGDVTTADSKAIANLAVSLLNNSNGNYTHIGAPFQLVQLEKIASQVVSGINYYLTLALSTAAGQHVAVEVALHGSPANPPIYSLTTVRVVSLNPPVPMKHSCCETLPSACCTHTHASHAW